MKTGAKLIFFFLIVTISSSASSGLVVGFDNNNQALIHNDKSAIISLLHKLIEQPQKKHGFLAKYDHESETMDFYFKTLTPSQKSKLISILDKLACGDITTIVLSLHSLADFLALTIIDKNNHRQELKLFLLDITV